MVLTYHLLDYHPPGTNTPLNVICGHNMWSSLTYMDQEKLFNIITEPNMQTMPGSGIPCPVCQKKFSSNRSLSDHRRQVHEKANHIKCPHCDFSTFQPYMLKRHVQRQHTKTTKFDCDQCSYFTYDVGSINVHKRRIHNKTMSFQCTECDKRYEKKREYAQHLLQSHNIVYQYNV